MIYFLKVILFTVACYAACKPLSFSLCPFVEFILVQQLFMVRNKINKKASKQKPH